MGHRYNGVNRTLKNADAFLMRAHPILAQLHLANARFRFINPLRGFGCIHYCAYKQFLLMCKVMRKASQRDALKRSTKCEVGQG